MSQETRNYVAQHVVFQDEHEFRASGRTQRSDICNPDEHGFYRTDTELVAVLEACVRAGWFVELTALRSDHGNDAALGPSAHAYGRAVDLWPLSSRMPGSYLDATDERFPAFLAFVSALPQVNGIGVTGCGDQQAALIAACGEKGFEDAGGPHIHVQVLAPHQDGEDHG